MIFIKGIQKFFFNGLLLSGASIILRGILVSFNAYISSKLGAEVMGLITLISSIYGFAITLATSGINLAVVRLVSSSIAKNDGNVRKIMKCAFIYALCFSLITSIILFISANNIGRFILGDLRTVSSLKLFALSLVPIALSSVLNGYFCAVRRVYKNVVVQFCEQGVKIGVVSSLLFLIAPYGIEFSCISVILGSVIAEFASIIISAVLYFFDRKIHSRKEHLSLEKSRIFDKLFFAAFPVGVSAYIRSALSVIEHLSIPWGLKKSGASSSYALASYGILHAMVVPLLLFPSCILSSFSSLLVPELASAYAKNNIERCRNIVSRVFSLSLLFSLLVSGIFLSYSYEIGFYLYNSYEAGEFLRLLAPLIPLMYLDASVDAMLKGLGEQLYIMRVNIADSIISVVLILTLLPVGGIYGYIAVIFITELFNTSLSIIKLLNITEIKPPVTKWILKPLATIIISSFITRLIFNFIDIQNGIVVIVKIIITVILYLMFSKINNKNLSVKEKPS